MNATTARRCRSNRASSVSHVPSGRSGTDSARERGSSSNRANAIMDRFFRLNGMDHIKLLHFLSRGGEIV